MMRGGIKKFGFKLLTAIAEVGGGKRIEIGCGDRRPKVGFRGADIRDCDFVDYVTEAWNLHKLVDLNSIVEVHGRHFLEHLTFSQCEATLRSIHSILRPEGLLSLEVPDLAFHAQQLLDTARLQEPSDVNRSWTNEQHMLAGFYGWQRDGFEDLWDAHKSGYTEDLLCRLLGHHGFINVTRRPTDSWNLKIQCSKAPNSTASSTSFFSGLFDP